MSEKEYIIAMEKGQSKDLLKDELTADAGNDYVPARSVDLTNSRNSSTRHFVMALTDEEAITLRGDPRVNSVYEPIVWEDDMLDFEVKHRTNWPRYSFSSNQNNWGLLRHIEATNGWGSNVTDQRSEKKYTGHLAGAGVDIVVQEGSAGRVTHEQFLDANGNSRYNQLQWNTLPNMSGANTITYGTSGGDHATHVMGTIGGLTVGWAPEAQLYSCPLNYLGNSQYWFDAIKEFHLNKTIDASTGYRRPTVLNMSWGYKTYLTNITAIHFRGSNVGTTPGSTYGLIGDSSSRVNCPIYGFQSEIEELHDAGVITIKSGGNQYQKLDIEGGIDYDNYMTRSVTTGNVNAGDPLYYNRGASNIGEDTIVVGNMDSQLYSDQEASATTSEKGPRVDIWAAGTNIISGGNTSDSTYLNYSGTSMSAPQVSGMAALLMQMNPGMTPKDVRNWFINNAKSGMYIGNTNNTTYFGNDRNLQDGNDKIAYWPYSDHRPINLSVDTEYVSF